MGGRSTAALRGAGEGSGVSEPLHPPCGDLEPAPGLVSRTDEVTFRWRDSAHGNQQRLLTLDLYEFLRRFLLHVLPSGFHRIRYYGFLTNSKRGELLGLCQRLIARVNPSRTITLPDEDPVASGWLCPRCGGRLRVVERFTAAELHARAPPALAAA